MSKSSAWSVNGSKKSGEELLTDARRDFGCTGWALWVSRWNKV
jgi:hypothetical protein